MWEREGERENGIKNTFFRDYSLPLLAPHPFRPLSGQMEVAEWWRDRRMKGGRDGGGRDDGWAHVKRGKWLATVGSNRIISSSRTTAAPHPSICPSSICPSAPLWSDPEYLTPAIGQRNSQIWRPSKDKCPSGCVEDWETHKWRRKEARGGKDGEGRGVT